MLKLAEVEIELGVSRWTLYDWLKSGKIRALRLPCGHYRVSREEVNKLKGSSCGLTQSDTGWTLKIRGKGNKTALVAISTTLAAQLQAYAYRRKLDETDQLFPITRSQAFRIVTTAFDRAGLTRPKRETDRVGAVHILRHSGAIERLRQTGNSKAVEDQLRHKSALMTMRYLKTLSHEESIQIQQEIDFKW